jgi:hypothetical protein
MLTPSNFWPSTPRPAGTMATPESGCSR